MHGMFQMKERTKEDFRFNSRKEYERAISELIMTSENDLESGEYDSLTEEYLRFCESLEDG
jgi:hypothetical protein